MRFLKNFRRGFATNSSSSHSFVYLKEDAPNARVDVHLSPEEYGWDDFTISSIKEKLFYVLVGYIGNNWPKSTERAKLHYENFGKNFPELSFEDFEAATVSYVDHQSLGIISEEHARDPRVVLFGGNDNGGSSMERALAVSSGLIDWSRTAASEEDEENIPPSDLIAFSEAISR